MAVNKKRAKLEDVPTSGRERFLKAQAKRERQAKREKEAKATYPTNKLGQAVFTATVAKEEKK